MAQNQVQFTWHANERLLGRLAEVVDYAQVQTVLQNKPLRNGRQQVVVTTLDKVVRVQDPELYNGYAQGRKIVAGVTVANNNEVTVQTVMLVDEFSKRY